MKTTIRVAETLSAVLILTLGVATPHGSALTLVLAMILGGAAGFVAWYFPARRADVVAMVLAVAVLVCFTVGPLGSQSSGGGGLHSPAMGLAFLPVPILLLAQIVAGIGAFKTWA